MRGNVLTAVVVAVVIQVPQVAYAHDISHSGSWSTSAYCVDETALVRDTSSGDGFSSGTVRTYKGNCSTAVNRDVQFLAEKLVIWFRRDNTDAPRLCAYTDYYYNPKVAWALQLSLAYPKTPYCGAGWYETEAGGWLWYGGKWRGGTVRSGQHFLNV
jgi:hypothetical protein